MVRLALACLALCGCDSVFGLEPRDTANLDAPEQDTAPASISFVESQSIAANNATGAVTVDLGPVVDGDLVVASVGTYSCSLVKVTDTLGDLYVEPGPTVFTGAGAALHVLYKGNTGAASQLAVTALVSSAGGCEVSLAVHVYRGAAIAPLDAHGTAVGASALSTVGTVMPAVAGEVVVAAISHDGSVSSAAGSGFTLREVPSDDPDGHVPLATEDALGVPAAPIDPSFALSGASPWAMSVLTFEPLAQ